MKNPRLERLNQEHRTRRLCTRGGMLESFLDEPGVLTDDDVMELLTCIFDLTLVQRKLNQIIVDRKEAIILKANETCEKHEKIHKKFLKMFWKGQKEKIAAEHKKELDAYNRALRYRKKQGLELPVDTDALQYEYAKLKLSHTELSDDLTVVKQDVVQLNVIRMCVDDLVEQQGMKISLPEMPKELQPKLEKELQQQEKRTENVMQAYMRHIKDAREQQKVQRTERKKTGDMER